LLQNVLALLFTSGKESQRLHLIAPIIICVCFLFNGDVQIEVEEDLDGDFLSF
jgi:ABC-type transport system involved in cytochrome c biogenesis permease component